MKEEVFTIRSSILPSLSYQVLLRGTLLGGVGALSLLLAGAFLPPQKMQVWGPFFFLVGLGMIAWGLLPYKRLKRLEEKPYRLSLEGDEWLHFSCGGKALLSIPIGSIESMKYDEKGLIYGIGIVLKNPVPHKVMIQDPSFNMIRFLDWSRKQHGCDLFLSYFSRRSFQSLQDYMFPGGISKINVPAEVEDQHP